MTNDLDELVRAAQEAQERSGVGTEEAYQTLIESATNAFESMMKMLDVIADAETVWEKIPEGMTVDEAKQAFFDNVLKGETR